MEHMENNAMEEMQEEDFIINIQEEDIMEDNDSLIGQTIHLVLDDESEMDTIIIAAFDVDGYPWKYIALLPLTEEALDEEDGGEVFLYRLQISEDGQPMLGAIESDEEYEKTAEVFYEEMSRLEEEAAMAESDMSL